MGKRRQNWAAGTQQELASLAWQQAAMPSTRAGRCRCAGPSCPAAACAPGLPGRPDPSAAQAPQSGRPLGSLQGGVEQVAGSEAQVVAGMRVQVAARPATAAHRAAAAHHVPLPVPPTNAPHHPPLDWRSASAMTPAAARMLPLLQRARSSSIAVSISRVTACRQMERGSTTCGRQELSVACDPAQQASTPQPRLSSSSSSSPSHCA